MLSAFRNLSNLLAVKDDIKASTAGNKSGDKNVNVGVGADRNKVKIAL
jgi:hypothetical protein